MKLTAAIVRNAGITPGKTEAIFFDDDVPGFGLRIREAGSRSFVFQYKLGTKQRRMALGTATALNFAATRKTAEQLYARVKLGQDPASDKNQAQKQAAETFIVAAEQFLKAREPKLRKRTLSEMKRHLTQHAKPLHELQLAKITRRDIAAVIVAVTNNKSPLTGNRVRTSLSTFFAWCLQHGLVEHNPVIGTERHKEQSRDRVLAPAELRAIWNSLADDHYGSIVKLLALTGQRRDEIGGLRRSELGENEIVLPKERTKNKRQHFVPLSAQAAEIIETQPARGERDLIFGRDDGAFSGWSNCKERLDKRIEDANGKAIAPWKLHDLRRSFATYAGGGLPKDQIAKLPARDKELAGGLGTQPHVIEAVLNHISGSKAGVAGVYNRSDYGHEKRIALDKWAERLIAIVEDRPSKITPLRREA